YGKYELTKSNCVVVVAPDSIVEPEDTSTFVDSRDGKVYHWVKIGEQTWMQENLAYDGIPGCWAYHNDIDNVTIYGYLYTWNAAMNAAPEGWHIPTKEEWEELAAYLGEEAGSKLAGNSALWENSALTESTNFGMSNFNGLPSGYRKDNGDYVNQAYETLWWSATEKNLYGSYFLSLFYTNTYLGIGYMDKTYAYSVRCIKDIE
ncbi:MAG: hypothetical protein JXR60_07860, partial [Bacteroidales bacterium]|nr:hypothetical protein [Bacteroidales bacterium]